MFMSEGTTYMVVRHGDYVFKKFPGNAGTVNVYYFDWDEEYMREVDVFTNYGIGSDFDKFAKQTRDWYEENILEEGEDDE